jgi:hypothetical protein
MTTVDAMNDNKIDVNPEYQREVVWTADRMSQLIDSLMDNFYIPPIIFNRKTNKETGEEVLICVDGKQRLSSVKAFAQGIIPCQDFRGHKWWYCNAHVHGKNKNILSETAKEEFLNKDFVTFEYTDLRPEQEEDLFARVQLGMPLSAAEKMRATSGPWQDLALHFTKDFPVIYSLQKDRMRAKDFQLTLSCFSQILEVQHPTPSDGVPMHKTTHSYLPKLLEKKAFIDDNFKSHLASVWKTLQDLIELDPDTFTNGDKRLKGVQMVAVTVLISTHFETRSNDTLLQDIRSLRENLRENFSDLRMNSYTWKAIWSFVDNLEKNRPAVGDNSIADREVPSSGPAPRTALAPVGGAKKGRPTARTKPPIVLPGSGSGGHSTAIKPEPIEPIESGLDLAESRPRKRQRAGSISGITKHHMSTTSAQDMAFQLTPTTDARTLSPFASLGAPIPAPRPKTCQRPASKAPSTSSLPTPGSTPPCMPAEARQNRESELDGYRAPAAPMCLGTGLTLRTCLPESPSLIPPNTLLQSHVTGSGHTEPTRPPVQTQKVVHSSTTAAVDPKAPAKSSRAAIKQKQKRKPKKQNQKSIPQYDSAYIDLTDDGPETVEEQRATLLSAFQRSEQIP